MDYMYRGTTGSTDMDSLAVAAAQQHPGVCAHIRAGQTFGHASGFRSISLCVHIPQTSAELLGIVVPNFHVHCIDCAPHHP